MERAQEKPLFKIKRAICEIEECDGKSVIIDKLSRKIYRLCEGRLIEICHVALFNTSLINWHEDVRQEIKDRAHLHCLQQFVRDSIDQIQFHYKLLSVYVRRRSLLQLQLYPYLSIQ